MSEKEEHKMDPLLARISRLHHKKARAMFESLNLYRGQPPVLFALWDHDGLSHSELADRMGIKPQTISKMVQRMEQTGFVARKADPDDQRISRVYLTPAGLQVQEAVQKAIGIMERDIFEGFSAEELELLYGFLIRIRDNLIRTTGKDQHNFDQD